MNEEEAKPKTKEEALEILRGIRVPILENDGSWQFGTMYKLFTSDGLYRADFSSDREEDDDALSIEDTISEIGECEEWDEMEESDLIDYAVDVTSHFNWLKPKALKVLCSIRSPLIYAVTESESDRRFNVYTRGGIYRANLQTGFDIGNSTERSDLIAQIVANFLCEGWETMQVNELAECYEDFTNFIRCVAFTTKDRKCNRRTYNLNRKCWQHGGK